MHIDNFTFYTLILLQRFKQQMYFYKNIIPFKYKTLTF
jgi:hypothetical protein